MDEYKETEAGLCCGKRRDDRFCSSCGKPLGGYLPHGFEVSVGLGGEFIPGSDQMAMPSVSATVAAVDGYLDVLLPSSENSGGGYAPESTRLSIVYQKGLVIAELYVGCATAINEDRGPLYLGGIILGPYRYAGYYSKEIILGAPPVQQRKLPSGEPIEEGGAGG